MCVHSVPRCLHEDLRPSAIWHESGKSGVRLEAVRTKYFHSRSSRCDVDSRCVVFVYFFFLYCGFGFAMSFAM